MTNFGALTTGDEVATALRDQIKGKTILITGPSKSSIGAETAISIAAGSPKLILLAGRTQNKIQPVIDTVQQKYPAVATTFIALDLADQDSVRKAAKEILSKIDSLDVLINNAGVMGVREYTTTVQGIETQFGINHIGHFLLTKLLMPKLLAAKNGARVINVSSFGHLAMGVRFDDWNFKDGKEYNPWLGYAQSKTANILFSSALARKLKKQGLLSYSVNPGLIPETNLQSDISQEEFAEGIKVTMESLGDFPMPAITAKPLAAGSATSIYAAFDPSLKEHSGAFLTDCGVYGGIMKEHTVGIEKEDALWELSEELVGGKFEV
ncbi:hypothetical protein BP5796_11892 [Coleophoma crateriformis]|uniref:Uncharacterized protein n=1 Tax=Coleophoma crateriformis TaxID=565419 RepID=A0A3D8QEL3_9HELO|nr:hypothetical protein BP5796_11892 [Coleophoma crateriformis]